MDTGSPVVPVTISGARRMWPPKGFPALDFGDLLITVHAPVESKVPAGSLCVWSFSSMHAFCRLCVCCVVCMCVCVCCRILRQQLLNSFDGCCARLAQGRPLEEVSDATRKAIASGLRPCDKAAPKKTE